MYRKAFLPICWRDGQTYAALLSWYKPRMDLSCAERYLPAYRAALEFRDAVTAALEHARVSGDINKSQEARVAWTNDITTVCNEYGIPRAYWEYKSGFGFADWDTGKLTNPELLKAITQ